MINQRNSRWVVSTLVLGSTLMLGNLNFGRAEEAAKPAETATAGHECNGNCNKEDCKGKCKTCKMKHGKKKGSKHKDCSGDCGCKDEKEKDAV